jgi:hypothetical protein
VIAKEIGEIYNYQNIVTSHKIGPIGLIGKVLRYIEKK